MGRDELRGWVSAWTLLSVIFGGVSLSVADDLWVSYPGGKGPGAGKRIVLISGDDEYRSEEALPQLGKILAKHHGFDCTVLFAIDPATNTIKPDYQKNIPGLEVLERADLVVLGLRFRDLPDEQMQHIANYLKAGKPVIGLRTSTHAFNLTGGRRYQEEFTWTAPDGGFGRKILGETWVAHHGEHGKQATRGILVDAQREHPILRGINQGEIFGPSDVYTVNLPLPGDSTPLVLGQVVQGMNYDDPPLDGAKNAPMMPVAWTKTYRGANGTVGRVFTTTLGASQDLAYEGTRRLVVNAVYWTLGIESQVPAKNNVDLVEPYRPTAFSFGGYQTGVKPSAHAWRP